MGDIHIHIHTEGAAPELPPKSVAVQESRPSTPVVQTVDGLDLLWVRIGEVRTLQIEETDADAETRDRRQGWVAGLLQAVQIIESGEVADLTEETWNECKRRHPFPEQSSELGDLIDYRQFQVAHSDRQNLHEDFITSKPGQRRVSPLEAAADPNLAHLVTFSDASGEEPDAIVSEEFLQEAVSRTEQTFDD